MPNAQHSYDGHTVWIAMSLMNKDPTFLYDLHIEHMLLENMIITKCAMNQVHVQVDIVNNPLAKAGDLDLMQRFH